MCNEEVEYNQLPHTSTSGSLEKTCIWNLSNHEYGQGEFISSERPNTHSLMAAAIPVAARTNDELGRIYLEHIFEPACERDNRTFDQT